jgi:hypothetical protein
MRRPSVHALFLALLPLAACGEGSKTADVVQAATKGAVEVGQKLADKAAELASLAPEEARTRLKEVLDLAARELKAVKDSETAQKIVAEVQRLLDRIVALGIELSRELDLAGLVQSVEDLIERFKSDPRVVNALETLREKLDALGR